MTEKLDLLWGAEKIGKAMGVPDHCVTRLFEKGQLPFIKRVGKRLVAERNAMKRYFIEETTTAA